ncbi:MAG: hypothetical protein HYU78_02505 [Rhodocyclales bacterium]|nr:hypothetical protein [Rhodocyclales bacterium]
MHRPRSLLAALAFAALALPAAADGCRIAFDLGSSGIRAGASNSGGTARAEIDYLGPLLAGRSLDETAVPTVAALRELPAKAGFAADCARVGGGFSAWRLALQQDAGKLAALLARIRDESGVAVLVVPQAREGSYGFVGARQGLGERLRSSHILDIGGGSLQVADERNAFGIPLGQKIWHHTLCREIRNADAVPCALQPMTGEELATARALAQEKLAGIDAALPGPVTMTAVSRPVTRGVMPAVARLAGSDASSFRKTALAQAIAHLAGQSVEETARAVGSPPVYAAFLLSDMLLVEGLLQATGSDELQVAELDLTNLPGLLADDRLFDWGSRYPCYLDRLRSLGLAAYTSDPASCP